MRLNKFFKFIKLILIGLSLNNGRVLGGFKIMKYGRWNLESPYIKCAQIKFLNFSNSTTDRGMIFLKFSNWQFSVFPVATQMYQSSVWMCVLAFLFSHYCGSCVLFKWSKNSNISKCAPLLWCTLAKFSRLTASCRFSDDILKGLVLIIQLSGHSIEA